MTNHNINNNNNNSSSDTTTDSLIPNLNDNKTLKLSSPSTYGSISQNQTSSSEHQQQQQQQPTNSDNDENNSKESWNYPRRNIGKTVAMFLGMIIFGMNDASVGVLVKSVSIIINVNYQIFIFIHLTN